MANLNQESAIIDGELDDTGDTGGPDFLNMSDEELASYDVTKFESSAAVVAEHTDEPKLENDDDVLPDGVSDPDPDPPLPGLDPVVTPDVTAEVGDKATTGTEGAKVNEPIDYKAKYEALLSPFKANGKDIQVDTDDDARTLMQMGANYNKKMQALKPSMKIMKLLESNGLLDESKLGFLIDLDKRDPAAINKLVADSKLDPLDLSADKAAEYQQKTYTVDERELELDAVLTDLQTSVNYDRTLDVVANKWDAASKAVIAANPEILRVIDEHIANGVYDVTASRLEKERMFGRMKGVSDIEAYKQIADKLHQEGAFVELFNGGSAAVAKTTQPPALVKQVPAKLSKADQDALDAKRRAAGSTKTTATAGKLPAADFNPLNMSDEEFAKLDAVKLFK